MADRYTILLNNYPKDAHLPGLSDGQQIAHIGIETDLPEAEVVKRLTDLGLEIDAVRTP